MATYPLDVLIGKWNREELSLEQAIGQVLLIIQKLDHRIKALEGRKPPYHRPAVSAPRTKQERLNSDASGLASSEERNRADDRTR